MLSCFKICLVIFENGSLFFKIIICDKWLLPLCTGKKVQDVNVFPVRVERLRSISRYITTLVVRTFHGGEKPYVMLFEVV